MMEPRKGRRFLLYEDGILCNDITHVFPLSTNACQYFLLSLPTPLVFLDCFIISKCVIFFEQLKKKGFTEAYEKIVQLKMQSPDGKMRLTACANTDTIIK